MHKQPIRIFATEIHAFGGVERLIVALADHLGRLGLDHEVACFHDSIDLASHATGALRVVTLNPARSVRAEARALKSYLDLGRDGPVPLVFDIKGAFAAGMAGASGFHLHLTDPPSLLPKDISKFALTGPRWSGGPRPGMATRLRGEVVHQFTRRGAKRATSLIAMTNRIASELAERYGRQAVVIRPGAHPLAGSTTAAVTLRNPRLILSVSRLEPNKRIEWLIEAMTDLVAADPAWQLAVVGGGNYRAPLEALVEQRGLADHVQFHGRIDDDALAKLFAQAAIFAMPAIQGYGLPALEALDRGTPVVIHGDSGVSEVLGDTPWVEIVNGDANAFVKGMARLAARIDADALRPDGFPRYPSESDWADAIARQCGWMD